ncbi:MAG TPA: peroxiredoxin [Dehalococcoidia bacterium]|nr:peroxiredoxin [Dehalococcoidia bacterium]
MAIAEGSAVPDVGGTTWQEGPTPTSLSDLFAGKKSILFGVPGAFTPTCSNEHLPSFVNDKTALEAKSIDQVVCMATNDIFVMEAWNKANGGDNVTMLADGNGDITRALDLGLDASGFGLGFRCVRFAAYIEDGTIKALNQEENPGSCELTSAQGILERV